MKDFPEDIPVTIKGTQKAVDCYNRATVLHTHVRRRGRQGLQAPVALQRAAGRASASPAGHGPASGRLDLLAPEERGRRGEVALRRQRHALAELTPKPDQVTVTVNTSQMNVLEQMVPADIAGTSLAAPATHDAYRNMIVPSNPNWYEEHIKRLSAAGIQSAFQCYNINSYATVERLIRRASTRARSSSTGRDRRRHGRAQHLQPRQLVRALPERGGNGRKLDAERCPST
jgi:hypothetical protein